MASDPVNPAPPPPPDDALDAIPLALPATPVAAREALPASDLVEVDVVPLAEPAEVVTAPPVPPRPHPGFWWSVLWSIVFLVVGTIAFVATYLVVLLGHAVLASDPQAFTELLRTRQLEGSEEIRAATRQGNFAGLSASHVVTILCGLVLIRLIVGRDWVRQLALRKPSLLHVGFALLAFPGILSLSHLAYAVGNAFLPSFHYQAKVEEMFDQWPWQLSILAIGLGPALCEELWFRGFLGRGLVGCFGPVTGVLLTACFFGAMHADPPHVLATMVLGLVLHFTYLMSRSLLVPMLLHFVNNSLAVVALNFGKEDPARYGMSATGFSIPNLLAVLEVDLANHFPLFAASLVLLVAACWVFYRSRVRLVAVGGPEAPAWQPPYPGVALPPPGSGTVPVQPWPGWIASLLLFASLALYVVLAWGFWGTRVPSS